jgi:nitroimidazol reductase NimA-like FMN-containing flavoprotein (pyridoxamine 5'-phosphate oxidase superfamily)
MGHSEPEQKAARILKDTIYATIATSSSEAEPWNSPLYIVYDSELNFYWASGKASRHSRNIFENPRVFLVIYDSSVPWGRGEGVYIQGEAAEVTALDEITKACRLRKERISDAKQPPKDFLADKPRSIYKATARKAWVNKDGQVNGYFVDQRVEIDLEALRRAIMSNV